MRRLFAWLVCVALAAACSPRGAVSPTAPPAPPESAPTPGLVVLGRVHLSDGTGLANVTICRNFASYPGTAVAVTGPGGSFQAPFVEIPGDEMVAVWALLPGYSFVPNFVRWRHYHGYEAQTLDFVAYPTSATEVPPVPCP